MIVQRMRRADPGALAQVMCARCDQPFAMDQPTAFSRFYGSEGWVHEVCPAATEFAFGSRDEDDVVRTWERRPLPAAMPPSSPLLSPELQVARALLHVGGEQNSSVLVGDVVGAAWGLVADRLAGRELDEQRDGLAAKVRELAGGRSPADRLLGCWRTPRRGAPQWCPGIAGLEPREAEAAQLAMEGWQPWEMKAHVKPKRDGDQPSLESIYKSLSEGRRKLRELFHMPAREET